MLILPNVLNVLAKALVIQRRFMTTGEKKLAYSVFGQSLRVDSIEIVAHRLILRNYAMSPNGHIYFNIYNWCDDFSVQNLGVQSWLIHELTHVWQIQQGIPLVRKALFDRRYDYVLESHKTFLQYGVEQQAQMVQDFFLNRSRGLDCQVYEQFLPFKS